MANISNRLKDLFHKYLIHLGEANKNSSVHHNPYYGCCHSPYRHHLNILNKNDFNGIIYFYEWSDSNRSPKTFYSLDSFERFLNISNIYLASYQRELIINIPSSYISCKKNGSLIIKCNYESLNKALNEVELPNKGSEDTEPYTLQITKKPIQKPMIHELEEKWDEMHPEVGGCWGW